MVYVDNMFLENYWEILCEELKEEFGSSGKSFSILSITKDDKKRVVNIEVEISDYDYFKVVLDTYKKSLSECFGSPYYAVQYKHNLITLFVKSQEDIYELEDYWFSDAEFIMNRRVWADFSFNLKQLDYWQQKHNRLTDIISRTKSDSCDSFEEWQENQKDIAHMEKIASGMLSNCQWYSKIVADYRKKYKMF